MKMKNKIFTAIMILSIPLFLTACTLSDIPVIGKYLGGGEDSNKAGILETPTTISMWGLWDTPELMDVLIGQYQSQNNLVTVSYEDRSIVKPERYKEIAIGRLKEGAAPDVMLVHNTWMPYIKDYLSPMPSSMMSAQDYSQKFYPVVTESAVFDEKVYAVPSYYDGLVLVYNKDHFDEIDQATPPTAWEEFRRLALSLTIRSQDGKFVRAGAAIGAANNIDFFSDILGLLFTQAGIVVPDQLDSKTAQETLSFYTLFLKTDGVWSEALPEASRAFVNEEVSMIFVPTWSLLDIINANPSLNIGVAPVPQAISENPTAWGSFWMYAVPKSSSNAKAAWDFVNYITQEQQQMTLFTEASRYRPFGAPSGLISVASQVASTPSYRYLKPSFDTAPIAKSGYFAARSGNTVEVEALRSAVNSVLSGKSAQEALTQCKQVLTGITR